MIVIASYPQECNKIFENEFLSHDRITSPQSPDLNKHHAKVILSFHFIPVVAVVERENVL